MSVARDPVTKGLASWWQGATSRPVAAMESPTLILETFRDDMPYGVVEPLDGSLLTRGWGNNWPLTEVPYAFLSYGEDVQSAEHLADNAREAFLDVAIPMFIPGVHILERLPDGGPGKPEEVATELWCVREPFLLYVESS